MCNKSPNSLKLMKTENEILNLICFNEVIDDFAKIKDRNVQFSAIIYLLKFLCTQLQKSLIPSLSCRLSSAYTCGEQVQ